MVEEKPKTEAKEKSKVEIKKETIIQKPANLLEKPIQTESLNNSLKSSISIGNSAKSETIFQTKSSKGTSKETKTEQLKEVKNIGQLLKNYEVLIHPLISEKAVNMIETQNKLTFVVNKKSSKQDIKNAIEQLYNVKINKINTVNDLKGRKKAIVKLDPKFKASDIATKLGVI